MVGVRSTLRTNDSLFAATDVALTSDWGVKVAELARDRTCTSQAVTRGRYLPNGDRLWNIEHPSSGYIRPVDIKVDVRSNVVVTAESGESSHYMPSEILTLKFDGTGNQLWARRLDFSDDRVDVPVALAV